MRRLRFVCLLACVLIPASLLTPLSTAAAQPNAGRTVSGRRTTPATHARVNMTELANRRSAASTSTPTGQADPDPVYTEPSSGRAPAAGTAAPADDPGGPDAPSPSALRNFEAAPDGVAVGSASFFIPPDTNGSVGPNHVMAQLNNNIAIRDKVNGVLSIPQVSLNTFWAGTGATGLFDPRTLYDRYNNRWLVAAVSNAATASSSVLIGISATSNPTGIWNLFRFDADAANTGWADFPMLGFNKNWVAVSWNSFPIAGGAFTDGRAIVLNYPTLRTGTATGTTFTGVTAASGGFSMYPATTFSPTEATLYLPAHISSGSATYKVQTITGTPAAPVLTIGATKTRTGGGWTQPSGELLPQQCLSGCPVTPRKIDANDAFMRSAPVFRNGSIWYAQEIVLPAGGISAATSHTAAQWTRLDTAGDFVDGGRVEDPTATATNGGSWFAFPSLSVNDQSDVLMGFSEMESDDFADAGYAFRAGTYAAGVMDDPVIYKEGEDYYQKTFGGTRNRWGDYSATSIDPSTDRDFWTIQEYADSRAVVDGLGVNDARWGTWWAFVQGATTCANAFTAGNDNIKGTNGADVLCGGDGNDSITGLDGNDTLLGGNGKDTLAGGKGDDVLDGGADPDTAGFYDSGVSAGMTIDLNATTTSLNAVIGTDTFVFAAGVNTIENVEGTPFDDIITGNALANVLVGRAGNDEIHGGDGGDNIRGMDGVDLLFGDGGDDFIQPGIGNDTNIDPGTGVDTLDYRDVGSGVTAVMAAGSTTTAGGGGSDSALAGFDNLFGTSFADDLDVSINGGASLVRGFGGNDVLHTSDGDAFDTILDPLGTNNCTDVDGGDTVTCS